MGLLLKYPLGEHAAGVLGDVAVGELMDGFNVNGGGHTVRYFLFVDCCALLLVMVEEEKEAPADNR